jgi:flagellar motility protein MotE (MotC chaperone)
MTRILTSTWMTALLSAVIYLGVTVLCWKTPKPPPVVDPAVAIHAAETGPSWNFTNPEADQLIAELKVEKKSLEKREQQLGELTVRLQAEQAELNSATQSVQRLQMQFDQNVLRIQEEEVANLKKLAKVYAAMAPETAANIFADLDDVPVVKIMVYMKDGETAAIFEAMAKKGEPEAKRAASISERLRLAAFRTNNAK